MERDYKHPMVIPELDTVTVWPDLGGEGRLVVVVVVVVVVFSVTIPKQTTPCTQHIACVYPSTELTHIANYNKQKLAFNE